LIKLRLEIGGFLDKRARHFRVPDRFSQLEKTCRPPREIVSADHDAFLLLPRVNDAQARGSFRGTG
jgi:hypothetical protein